MNVELSHVKPGAITPGFEEQIKNFKRLARKAAKRQKRGDVHDLRVATRRLRAALWLVKRCASVKAPAKTRSSLRKLGRFLGERRRLDVAIRDAKRYKLNAAKLKPLHRESSTALASFLTAKKTGELAKRLGKVHQELLGCPAFNFSKPMHALRIELGHWTAFPAKKTELHELRIQMKKILYVLEAVGQPAQPLVQIKDCLGRAHDLEELGKYFKNAKKIRTDEALEIKKAKALFQPALAFAMEKLGGLKPDAKRAGLPAPSSALKIKDKSRPRPQGKDSRARSKPVPSSPLKIKDKSRPRPQGEGVKTQGQSSSHPLPVSPVKTIPPESQGEGGV